MVDSPNRMKPVDMDPGRSNLDALWAQLAARKSAKLERSGPLIASATEAEQCEIDALLDAAVDEKSEPGSTAHLAALLQDLLARGG